MKIGILVTTVNFLYAQTGTDISGNFIEETDYTRMINPLDELAVEYGLQLRDKVEGATVTVVGYGRESEQLSCRHGLAMGADKAVCLGNCDLDTLNPYLASQLLKEACRPEKFDVILCGAESLDVGHRLEARFLAERLGMCHLSNVVALDRAQPRNSLAVERLIEGGNRQLMECDTPVLLTITQSGITARYPSLAGFLRADECEITTIKTSTDQTAFKKDAEKMKLQKFILPIPGRQNGTAALALEQAETRVSFMIEGDTESGSNGGGLVQAGSQEMFQRFEEILVEAGLADPPEK